MDGSSHEQDARKTGVRGLLRHGPLPLAAHAVLSAKRAKLEAHWQRNLGRLKAYARAHEGRMPADAHATDGSGPLAVWFLSVERQCLEGLLSKEKADALKSVCPSRLEGRCKRPSFDEKEDAAAYARMPGPISRVLSDIACAATALGVLALSGSAACALIALAASAILCVLAMCDECASILPFELSYSLYPLAFAYTLILGGTSSLIPAAVCAAAILALLLASRASFTALGRKSPCGLGDVRTLPSVGLMSSYPSIAYAAIAMAASLVVCAIRAYLRRDGSWDGIRTRLPMGASIAAAGMAGMAMQALALT